MNKEAYLRFSLNLFIATTATLNSPTSVEPQSRNSLVNAKQHCQIIDSMLPEPVLYIDTVGMPANRISALTVRGEENISDFWVNITESEPFSPELRVYPLVLERGERYTLHFVYRGNDDRIYDENIPILARDCSIPTI